MRCAMARGCDYSVWVTLDVEPTKGQGHPARTGLRTFIVEYDSDDEVLRIKERRLLHPGEPWQTLANCPYFKAGTHVAPPGSMPHRIMAAALLKTQEQDKAHAATP